MGDIWSQDHLVLFLAFFIPGFIASQIYALYVGVDDSDPVKRLPAVVGYSAIHYALTGWLILVVPEGRARAIVAYIVVFLLPLLWAPIILSHSGLRQKWKTIFLWNYSPINIKGGISACLRRREHWMRRLRLRLDTFGFDSKAEPMFGLFRRQLRRVDLS